MKFRVGQCEVEVNLKSKDALLKAVEQRLMSCKGFALATLNLDHLVKLQEDAGFSVAYGAQDFVVADGNPIVWLSKLAGRSVGLVPGSDMVLPLAELAAAQGAPIALLGATEQSLSASAEALQRLVPNLQIAEMIAPPMGFDAQGKDARQLLERLGSSGAGLVFVALGAPKQEMFAALGREVAPGLGFASIGAGLDFYSGAQKRAPRWMRALALEWLWRLLGAPARMMPRYAKCFAILPRLTLQALGQRFR